MTPAKGDWLRFDVPPERDHYAIVTAVTRAGVLVHSRQYRRPPARATVHSGHWEGARFVVHASITWGSK